MKRLHPLTRRPDTKGITLLEILITLIVLGILSAFAIPALQKPAEKSRYNEGVALLELISSAQKIYRLNFNTFYPPGNGTVSAVATINSNLDIDMPVTAESGFNLSVRTSGGGSNFDATLTRVGGSQNGRTITIDDTDTLGGTFPPSGG
ncbi:MAG: prepilin-type N-terminal cleavage/methylation domain-containing protein [Candidatus Omnitrophica bacterium]|nr:prepilin-type N-terminal cleavage/methylation domain-containing protein [Candidatus Omnitrophota bacterium]